MTPITRDFEPFTEGDHWGELAAGMSILVNNVTPSNALEKVRIRFKPSDLPVNDPRITERVELTSDDVSQIVIVNAATWEFYAPKQQIPGLKAGTWKFNIEFTDSQGIVETYIEGNQPVIADV